MKKPWYYKSLATCQTILLVRHINTTVQFFLTFILLLSSLFIIKQLHFLLDKDLGFETSNRVSVTFMERAPFDRDATQQERNAAYESYTKNYQYVKDQLSNHSSIKNFTQGSSPISATTMPWKRKDSDDGKFTSMKGFAIFPNYLQNFEMRLTQGRSFDAKIDKGREHKVLINEAALKAMNIDTIANQRLSNKYWSSKEGWEIIGVLKDFNSSHLSTKPQPAVFYYFGDANETFYIQLAEGAEVEGVAFLKSLYEEVNPDLTFSYSYLEDDVAQLYESEKRLSYVVIIFTMIAFLISSIGLLTIVMYESGRRTKEVGIRKVNGATFSEILTMLNIDFIKWITLAFAIATPVTYLIITSWLENFAYKTSLNINVFIGSGVAVLLFVILAVSIQSWKVVRKNPSETLRAE